MILCYHKIHPQTKSVWWISVDRFYLQMAALKSKKVVYLDDYDPLNPDHVVITFDGVYENVLQYAVPIMEKFGFPFELFIIGDYIGKENTFDQSVEPPCMFADLGALDEMVRRGGRIQWHTRSHKDFSSIDDEMVAYELLIPAELPERYCAPHLNWFAYPHGRCSNENKHIISNNFKGALACDDGDVLDPYYLPRKLVFEHHCFFRKKVTAIVANYNYGRFIEDAIDSIERQTSRPDEILIIDDASTDDSLSYLKNLENKGYRVVYNERNLGIVENFRKAVTLSAGDYVFFLGADNRIRSDFVLECRIELDSHDDVAIAYTDMLLWGTRSSQLAEKVGAVKIARSEVENWNIYYWKMSEPNAEALVRFEYQNFIHGSSMYKRDWYERVGGYKSSDGPEDHNLFLRIWKAGGGLAYINKPLLEYRQHSKSQANTVLITQSIIASLRRDLDNAATVIKGLKWENDVQFKERQRLYREVEALKSQLESFAPERTPRNGEL